MGSIAKWALQEGSKFEAGTAICEVETDKATVTYEATEDGYIAKILVGTGEVKVRVLLCHIDILHLLLTYIIIYNHIILFICRLASRS